MADKLFAHITERMPGRLIPHFILSENAYYHRDCLGRNRYSSFIKTSTAKCTRPIQLCTTFKDLKKTLAVAFWMRSMWSSSSVEMNDAITNDSWPAKHKICSDQFYKRLRYLKGIVRLKMNDCWKCTRLHAIQDVECFFSSSEQIWRNLALHHLLTSAVNGCRQNESSSNW